MASDFYLVIGAVEVEALLKSCLPLTPLRGFLFLTASAGFFCAVLLFLSILSLPLPQRDTLFLALFVSAAAILAERLAARLTGRGQARSRCPGSPPASPFSQT